VVHQKLWLPSALALLACAVFVPAFAAEKISTVATIGDLVTEIELEVKDFESNLADASKFKKKQNARAANVLAVLAQAVAVSDEEAPLKKSAPALRDAALALGKADSAADATKALEGVKAALAGSAGGSASAEYDWAKFMDVHNLMEEVQSRNAKLGKAIRKGTLEADSARHATVLAVLGLTLEANPPKDKQDKKDVESWKQFSKDFSTGFTGLTASIKSNDIVKVRASYSAVSKSCAGCHEKFKE
jgi:cytochrome c556